MLIFALTAVFFTFLSLITDIPLKFRIAMRRESLNIRFTVRLFYGLIPVNIFLRIEYLPRGGIKVIIILKKGRTKVLNSPGKSKIKKAKKEKQDKNSVKSKIKAKFKKELLFSVLTCINFKSLEAAGEIGIREDPFATVMLAGFIKIILDTSTRLFIFNLTGSGKNTDLCVGFFPCMTRNAFSLNLEGIAAANKPKLIKKAVCVSTDALIKLIRQNINKNKGDISKCILSKT